MSSEPPVTRFRDHTTIALEFLIATLTLLPFLALIYFYPTLPERIPEYLNLHGEVVVWAAKVSFPSFGCR